MKGIPRVEKSFLIFVSFCFVFVIDSCAAVSAKRDRNVYVQGGIVRTDPSEKQIALVFTAAMQADGTDEILAALRKSKIKGAFFFTGHFFERFPGAVQQIRAAGHYIGPHGYGHLLYCAWENRDSTLVTRETFEQDLVRNRKQLTEAGVRIVVPSFFMPPYEYYNQEVASWVKEMGMCLVNYTPGSTSNADYTTPDMKNYRSSQSIYDRILEVESAQGLNGHILLFHLGTHEKRTDKFYRGYLDRLIRELKHRGYCFVTLEKATGK